MHDLAAEPEHECALGKPLQRRYGHRTAVATPLLRDDKRLGVIAVMRRAVRPFGARQLALLQTFADQAAIAIENAHLFAELQARNAELSQSLARQTATAEVLQAISRSPTELQPVLDAVAQRAALLCRAQGSPVWLAEGEQLQAMTIYGPAYPEGVLETLALRATSIGRRAFLERRCLHADDIVPLRDSEPRRARNAGAQRLSHRAGGGDAPRRPGHRPDLAAVQ